MPTYQQNLDRLRQGSRASTKEAMQITTAAAQERGQAGIKHVQDIRSKLEPFSGHLRDWKKLDIAHKEKLGMREARKARKEQVAKLTEIREKIGILEAAEAHDPSKKKYRPKDFWKWPKKKKEQWMEMYGYKGAEIYANDGSGALVAQFDSVEAQHDELTRLKGEQIRLKGLIDGSIDGARLEKLSPHSQVGYAKEKLRMIGDSWPDQLQYWMQNSEIPIKITLANGMVVEAVPKEVVKGFEEEDPDKQAQILADIFSGGDKKIAEKITPTLNDVGRLDILEHILDVGSDELFEELGLDAFSDEFLEVTGIEDIIQKTKESRNAKYRSDFVVTNGANLQAQAKKQFQNSEKTADDFARMLLNTKFTANQDGEMLGNAGSLDLAFKELQQIGINNNNTGIADHFAEMTIPTQLAGELGVKPGTTFGERWPSRFSSLKNNIKAGYVKAVNAEREYQEAFGTELNNRMTQEIRESALAGQPMTTERLNWYKDQFGKAGLPIPPDVSKWETVSQRDARKDKGLIEALRDSQGGVITNQQLDQFNPSAASEFRKEADAYEKGILEDYNVENLIKAALDTTFTGMGLKGNEKNRVYQEAFKNAKIDYIKQFNKLRNMGLPVAHANYLALNGTPGEGQDLEGRPLVGFHGVLHEINTKGEGSKYVITGQNVQDSLGDAFVRVGYINTAKKQIQKNKNSVTTGLLGGQYGQDQLNIIAANIEKYGLDKGLNMSDEAVEFYRGIARGTDLKSTGGWMGILDAQLKANIPEHQGLWPNEDQPNAITLATGMNAKGEFLPDPLGRKALTDQALRAIANANSYPEFLHAIQLLQDAGYDTSSIFDNPENLVNYLGE